MNTFIKFNNTTQTRLNLNEIEYYHVEVTRRDNKIIGYHILVKTHHDLLSLTYFDGNFPTPDQIDAFTKSFNHDLSTLDNHFNIIS